MPPTAFTATKARGEKDLTLLNQDSRTRAITIRLRHKFTMFPQSSYPYRNSSGHSCNTGFILVINTGFIIIGINLILYCISIVTNTISRPVFGWLHVHRLNGLGGGREMETRGKKAAGPGCGAPSVSAKPGPFLRARPGRKQRQHKPGSHRYKPTSHGGGHRYGASPPNMDGAQPPCAITTSCPAVRVPR